MDRSVGFSLILVSLAALSAAGCRSPYRADQGALFGGLLGAGTGAIIGDALGNAGAGAAIGAGVGAISGAAIGENLDQIEAQNRAMIEAQMGHQVAAGAVTLDDVIAMTQAGVNEELIVTHVRAHGITRPLETNDLIFLQQQGVSTRVVKAMQEPPPAPQSQPVIVQQRIPAPVIVEEYHIGPPVWPAHYYHPHRRPAPRRSGVSWGVSFHD